MAIGFYKELMSICAFPFSLENIREAQRKLLMELLMWINTKLKSSIFLTKA
jgi:hypothetical protein